MPTHVRLSEDALRDLEGYARTGNLRLFLRKLVWIEEAGVDAGQPLRAELGGWRKVVVGDRTWRIIFRAAADGESVTIWAIGDRDDAECYETARRRLQENPDQSPASVSLAAAMLTLFEARRSRRR